MTIEKISAFITSITSIAALLISTYTFVKQTQQAKITLAVNLLRDIEKHFFYSDEMRQKRCVTAKFLLNRDIDKDPPPEAYELLDFFDTVALHVNKGVIDVEMAWITFYWWFDKYWHLLSTDVEKLHQDNDGVKYLENSAKLHLKLTEFGMKRKNLPNTDIRHSPEKIKEFLFDEVNACDKA